MARVYIPNPLNVQMPATQENPAGHVIQLQQGWIDADDDLMTHPTIAQLVPQSDAEQKRQERLGEAVQKRDQAIHDAHMEYAAAVADCDQEVTEERNAAAEDRTKRADDAAKRGVVFNEPHPDPEAERARSLTAAPGTHVTTAASLLQKPQGEEDAKKLRDNLPSEEESHNKSRARLSDEEEEEEKKTTRAKSKG